MREKGKVTAKYCNIASRTWIQGFGVFCFLRGDTKNYIQKLTHICKKCLITIKVVTNYVTGGVTEKICR